jgi:hypothetical protein
MNRTFLAISLLGATVLAAGAAQAQTEPDGTAAKPERVNITSVYTPLGIYPGSNPTAEEAIVKQEIHDAGYTGVASLSRMPDGSWQAQALKNDAYYDVTVDHSGHVMQQ